MNVDLAGIGGSALTDRALAVPESADHRHTRSPMCRHAIRCCCRWRWAGPKSSERTIFSSASMRSTIRDIRTAGRSSSLRSSRWRSWPRARAWRARRFAFARRCSNCRKPRSSRRVSGWAWTMRPRCPATRPRLRGGPADAAIPAGCEERGLPPQAFRIPRVTSDIIRAPGSGPLAQSVEQLAFNQLVARSNRARPTKSTLHCCARSDQLKRDRTHGPLDTGPNLFGGRIVDSLCNIGIFPLAPQCKLSCVPREREMRVSGIAKRIAKADFQYIFGRFQTVRAMYGVMRRVTDAPFKASADSRETLFPGIDIPRAVQAIRDEAVFEGFNLPASSVAAIKSFALKEPLHAIYDPNGPTFHYSDVARGVAADGRPMPIGGIRDPARCPAVQAIINDPVLRSIIRDYLGHEPRKLVTILDWSFGSAMSDEERRQFKHVVIDYHYDVGGLNFVHANFYITDTDRHSGAHVMMRRSHKRKPLRMLLGSARASEQAVHDVFGRENELVVEGPAGTGFIQDTSCFHRALPSTGGDRLMLAIRFIN